MCLCGKNEMYISEIKQNTYNPILQTVPMKTFTKIPNSSAVLMSASFLRHNANSLSKHSYCS